MPNNNNSEDAEEDNGGKGTISPAELETRNTERFYPTIRIEAHDDADIVIQDGGVNVGRSMMDKENPTEQRKGIQVMEMLLRNYEKVPLILVFLLLVGFVVFLWRIEVIGELIRLIIE